MNVNVHLADGPIFGSRFAVQVSLDSTVSSLKSVLAGNSDIEVEKQRLIYKGTVLKDDDRTLQSYGLKGDNTLPVHLFDGSWSLTDEERESWESMQKLSARLNPDREMPADIFAPIKSFSDEQKRLIKKYPSWTRDCFSKKIRVNEFTFIMLKAKEGFEKDKEAEEEEKKKKKKAEQRQPRKLGRYERKSERIMQLKKWAGQSRRPVYMAEQAEEEEKKQKAEEEKKKEKAEREKKKKKDQAEEEEEKKQKAPVKEGWKEQSQQRKLGRYGHKSEGAMNEGTMRFSDEERGAGDA